MKPIRVRAWLALMAAAILVPVVVFSAIALDTLLTAQREAALRSVRETARIALVSIDRELTNAQASLRMLATSPQLDAGDLAGFYRQARNADRAGIWTLLLDSAGQPQLDEGMRAEAGVAPEGTARRVARALQEGRPQVSNLIRGADPTDQMVMVDVPVSTPSGLRYVVAQGFKVDHFARTLRQVHPPAGWQMGVFDRNGIMIARAGSDPAASASGDAGPDLREAIRNSKVGVIRGVGEGDKRIYTILERSSLSGWTVAVGVPEAEIEKAAREAIATSAMGLAAALVCAGLAAFLFARHIGNALGHAAQAAQALSRHAPVPPPGDSGVAEVDELEGALHRASASMDIEPRGGSH